MNKKDTRLWLAPLGVITAMSLFIGMSVYVTRELEVHDLHEALSFVPSFVIVIVGAISIITFAPISILGIYFLGRRGARGQAEALKTNGIYKYVRNPMYSGASFSFLGLGLVVNETGLALLGILWLVLTFVQCKKREEKELEERFGEEYTRYRKSAPMYIPNLARLTKDVVKELARNRK